MALVYLDKSSVTDYYLNEVIPEQPPGVISFSVCAVVSMNLVGLIYTIHKMIIHINEIRNLKALKWLISEYLFNLFIFFIWPLSHLRNSHLSINKCRYK